MVNNILGIDDHYIRYPKNSWGGTDLNNKDMVNAWLDIYEIVNPKKVVEIGMWAGHSALIMMNVFKNLKSLDSYDPDEQNVSEKNSRQIKKYYPQFSFHKEAIWGNEHRHSDIDLIFVDGHHGGEIPKRDLQSCMKIKPRFILVDNLELVHVREACKIHYKLWDLKYEPKYYFYTNIKYSSQWKYTAKSPGIMGLFKMEGTYDNF